ncbi:DoxX family protein [Marine Group I thaumarchaeote SCGC RSA3]|uniref:DoxX family protein n=1 Tax=Marine Group I thaumarchaeote SCGC RSA3 TaxID=1503183 RepID=A0A087RQF4_9ARCH|nr:DoxX family protein [Marine Group I thaumarchaeote SCGC RSA3]
MLDLATAEIREKILNDVVFMRLRSVIGVIFIVHGLQKFNELFANALTNMGLPAELQIPIAFAEIIPGIWQSITREQS